MVKRHCALEGQAMAAIASKLGQQPHARSVNRRQGRVARVSAKRASKKRDERPGDAHEPDADPEALAGDDAAEVNERKRPDTGTYLSMYFRDMAALDVLRPEEEFTAAREIEALEIMLWQAVLAHPPGIPHVLGAVEIVVPPTHEVRALRRAAEDPDAKTY